MGVREFSFAGPEADESSKFALEIDSPSESIPVELMSKFFKHYYRIRASYDDFAIAWIPPRAGDSPLLEHGYLVVAGLGLKTQED